MSRAAQSWWLWCGSGALPAGGGYVARVGAGSGRRRFAAFALAPAEEAGLRFAVGGNCAVALAGRLANRAEIEKTLSSAPPPGDDAELVLRCFLQRGIDVLADLRGRFAVAVWDGEREVLVATRDPVGTHPLFWAEAGDALVLSDSLETLLARDHVARDLNPRAFADHLRHRWPDLGETYYSKIRRVPPGHTLTDLGRQRTVRRTWNPPSATDVGWASPSEIDQFHELFTIAVDRCLELGPVGIWLSGGLDSVSVAAVAAERSRSRALASPTALSLRFPDPGVDESAVQRSVASQLGLPLVMRGLDDAAGAHGIVEAAVELSRVWPAPMLYLWLPAYLALSRAGVERGCTALLTGGGGDEWLGVSPYLAADLLAAGDLRGWARLVLANWRSFPMPAWRAVHGHAWRFGLRPLIGRRVLPSLAPKLVERRDRNRLHARTPGWLAPDPELRRAIDDRYVPPAPVRSFYERERYTLDYPLVAIEFEDLYEAGRRLGAPILFPFLDADLIELLVRIPPDALNEGGRSKGLVRSTLATRFPDLGFGRHKKVSAGGTVDRVLGHEAEQVWRRRPGAPALAQLGVVEADALETWGDRVVGGGSPRERLTLFEIEALEAFAASRL